MKHKLLLLMAPLLALGLVSVNSLLQSAESKTKILKFEAAWCGPCQQMKPIYSRVSRRMSSDASFSSINIDRNRPMAEKYKVTRLPTIIAVKNGRVVGRKTGFLDEKRLTAFVKRHS